MTAVRGSSLKTVGVTKTFDGLRAVAEVSMEVNPGECFGVIGPNGAGKSTLLNLVSGVYEIDQGQIWIQQRRIDGMKVHTIAELGVGRSFQTTDQFSDFTAIDYLLLGRHKFVEKSLFRCCLSLKKARRTEREQIGYVKDMLASFGLLDLRDASVGDLSYGTRKLLDVLRAYAMEPTLLLLDEPTSGTTPHDRVQLRNFIETVRKEGTTVVLVDHDVKFVTETCDRVMVMNFGTVIATGDPATVLASPDVQRAYLGIGVDAN